MQQVVRTRTWPQEKDLVDLNKVFGNKTNLDKMMYE